MKEPGVPGDPEHIIYAADRFGMAYQSALEWGIEFNRLRKDDVFGSVFYETSKFANEFIIGIEEFSKKALKDTSAALERVRNGEKGVKLELILTMKFPENKKIHEELDKIKRTYGLHA
jgi:hypothetical protein